ncbi:MAG: hypothetical protein ABIJ40_18910 [Bacteroidota bacterium]
MTTVYNDIAQNFNFIHRVGNDSSITLTVVNSLGVAFDFTGYTIQYVIYSNLYGTVFKTFTPTIVGNLVTVTLTEIDNAVVRSYWYEWIFTVNGITKTWFAGQDRAIVGAPLGSSSTGLSVTVNTASPEITATVSVYTTIIANFAIGENLAGTKNGTNRIFTMANTPITNSEMIIFAGTVLERAVDYTISGVTVTLSTSIPAPTSGEMLKINYIKQ